MPVLTFNGGSYLGIYQESQNKELAAGMSNSYAPTKFSWHSMRRTKATRLA